MGILLNKSKNFIINGAMDYWQRGTSFSGSTSTAYASDRFRIEGSGTSTQFTSVRSVDVPSSEFPYSLQSSKTNTSNSSMAIAQRIERELLRPLFGKSVTLSLWYKGTAGRIGFVFIMTPTSATPDGWPATRTVNETVFLSQNITFDGTWQKISITFTMDASTQNGIAPAIQLNGSTAEDILRTTGWQLEEGVSASNFERAGGDIINELQLCQRYFEKSYNLNNPVGSTAGLGGGSGMRNLITSISSTAIYEANTEFKIRKRAIPVVTFYGPSTGTPNRIVTSGAVEHTVSSVNTTNESNTGYPSVTVSVASNIQLFIAWAADAEL